MKTIGLALVALSVVAATSVAAASGSSRPTLPSGFVGHWSGTPTTSVVGPWAPFEVFNFSILPVPTFGWHNYTSSWLMADHFDGYYVRDSFQQYWVTAAEPEEGSSNNANGNSKTTTTATTSSSSSSSPTGYLTYCGVLMNYYLAYQPVTVWLNMTLKSQADDKLVFSYPGYAEWTLKLSDNNTKLHSKLQLGEPSVHLDVHLTRMDQLGKPLSDGTVPLPSTVTTVEEVATHLLPHVSEKTRKAYHDAVRSVSVPNGGGGGYIPWPCNLTLPTAAPPATKDQRKLEEAKSQNPPMKESKCPHGFTAADGPMPSFVKKKLQQQGKMEERKKEEEDVVVKTASALKKPSLEAEENTKKQSATTNTKSKSKSKYQFCYVLNRAQNITLEWNWNTAEHTVDMQISGSGSDQQYIAFGVYPGFPGMMPMDIVLGYFPTTSTSSTTATQPSPCVRSMYAKYFVGMPEDYANQTLSATSMSVQDGRLSMAFTRPWKTGHHDLTPGSPFPRSANFPLIAWAMGSAASSCGSDGFPGYHNNLRASVAFDFENPSAAMPDWMKC